jgi:hypothetical protein
LRKTHQRNTADAYCALQLHSEHNKARQNSRPTGLSGRSLRPLGSRAYALYVRRRLGMPRSSARLSRRSRRQLRLHALLIAFRIHGTLRRQLNRLRISVAIAWQQGPSKCTNCLVMPPRCQAQRPHGRTAEKLPGGDIFVDLLSQGYLQTAPVEQAGQITIRRSLRNFGANQQTVNQAFALPS